MWDRWGGGWNGIGTVDDDVGAETGMVSASVEYEGFLGNWGTACSELMLVGGVET